MKLWFPAGVEMLSAQVRRNKADTARKDATQKFDNSQSTCWWLDLAVYRIGGLMFRLVPYTFARSQGYKPVWRKRGG